MIRIQPIDLAIIGIAEYFKLSVLQFSMQAETATFYYELLDTDSKVLYQGNLTMSPEIYEAWGSDNSYCIDWASDELGLVLIPEEIIKE